MFITFPSIEQEQWWKATGPVLCRILAAAGYPRDQQYQYLTFHHAQVVPRLGPYPPRFSSGVTRSGLPMEFSVNYQQHETGNPMVRIGLEPVDTYSGTARDPFNQTPPTELFSALTRLGIPGFDPWLFTLFTLFADEHTLTVADRHLALDRGILLRSQHAFGFDLKNGGMDVKVDGDSGESGSKDNKNKLDCVDAFATVREYVSSPAAKRLPGLHPLLDTLQLREASARQFAGGKGSYSDDSVEEQDEAPMLWNYEMKIGNPVPLTKYYFPLYGVNDLVCVRRLAEFFDGWAGVSPDRDLSMTARLLLWVSFAYTAKNGVYLSVYYYPSLDFQARPKM
ncbi:DMATS type aromatic prenyltransferase [Aspergillus ustus]|uniref:DMATS type aromatic prenyltransferase n=1 Tax=Aspergillus ustus TaxID=40382 RepID=A0A0C1C4A4_ASPUT|nr:DMATS type aromatic prenyltransferase [Aspergillus ustus]